MWEASSEHDTYYQLQAKMFKHATAVKTCFAVTFRRLKEARTGEHACVVIDNLGYSS